MRELVNIIKAHEIMTDASPISRENLRSVRATLIEAGIVFTHKDAEEQIVTPFLASVAMTGAADGVSSETPPNSTSTTTQRRGLSIVGEV